MCPADYCSLATLARCIPRTRPSPVRSRFALPSANFGLPPLPPAPSCHAVSMLRNTPQQAEEYKAGSNRNPAALRGARPRARPRAVRRPSSARRRVSVVGSPVVCASVACRGSGLPLVLRVPPASRARLGGRGRSGRLSAALASRRPTACLRPALGPSSRPASRSRPLPRHAPASLLRSPLLPAPLGARVRWLAVALGERAGGPPSPLRDLQT